MEEARISVAEGHIDEFADMFADKWARIEAPKLVLEADDYSLVVEPNGESLEIRKE